MKIGISYLKEERRGKETGNSISFQVVLGLGEDFHVKG